MDKRDITRYFARPMDFTDVNGNRYPSAVCVPGIEKFDSETKTIAFVTNVYRSAESFNSGEPPIHERDGGVRRIEYRGEAFDRFGAQNAAQIAAIALLIHDEFDRRKDTPDGRGNMVSFFTNAGPVILPDELKQ